MKKKQFCYTIILTLLTILFAQSAYATTYYVATNGSDVNAGTNLNSPFKTVQKALGFVKAGDTINIRGGTYNESIKLMTSGTAQAPITIQNYNNETVTINSGGSQTLSVSALRIGYYTIEGIKFIATYRTGDQKNASMNFQGGWLAETAKNGGNDGFILKNCYVQGAVRFYGQSNLMEGCEVYGNNKAFVTGVADWWAPSHDNTYRNNVIHSFSGRGFWSMSYVVGDVIEGNKVYDCSTMGIDLDGASHPDQNAIVKGNEVYNIAGGQGVGILLENAFNCQIDGNRIHDVGHEGIQVFVYGTGCGFQSDAEYRNTNINTTLMNNIIYNVNGGDKGGINAYSARGVNVYGNTIYNARGAGIKLNTNCGYSCSNWIIENNILYKNDQTISGSSPGGTIKNNLTTNPQFVDEANDDFHLKATSPAIDAGVSIPALKYDFDGVSRPQGSGYDIGAYEYAGAKTSATVPGPPTNFRVSGK